MGYYSKQFQEPDGLPPLFPRYNSLPRLDGSPPWSIREEKRKWIQHSTTFSVNLLNSHMGFKILPLFCRYGNRGSKWPQTGNPRAKWDLNPTPPPPCSLGGNAPISLFLCTPSKAQMCGSPRSINRYAQASSFKATTFAMFPQIPAGCDSALLLFVFPRHPALRFVLAASPSETKSSVWTKARACSSWHPLKPLSSSVFQTKKGLREELLKMKCHDK